MSMYIPVFSKNMFIQKRDLVGLRERTWCRIMLKGVMFSFYRVLLRASKTIPKMSQGFNQNLNFFH